MKRTRLHFVAVLLLVAGISAGCSAAANAQNARDTAAIITNTKGQAVQTRNLSAAEMTTLREKVARLKESMLKHIERSGGEFTKRDVQACADILTTFLQEINKTRNKTDGLLAVKSAVEKLNTLNDRLDNAMIETDERESIAEIIIQAGSYKGYNAPGEDITEPWRSW